MSELKSDSEYKSDISMPRVGGDGEDSNSVNALVSEGENTNEKYLRKLTEWMDHEACASFLITTLHTKLTL